MCLINSEKATEVWSEKHKDEKRVRAWKVLVKREGGLRAPCHSFGYHPGVNKAEHIPDLDYGYVIHISYGIHVFLTKEHARGWCHFYEDDIIVPVWVKPDELLGVNEEFAQAVFRSLEIDEEDYKEALNVSMV